MQWNEIKKKLEEVEVGRYQKGEIGSILHQDCLQTPVLGRLKYTGFLSQESSSKALRPPGDSAHRNQKALRQRGRKLVASAQKLSAPSA